MCGTWFKLRAILHGPTFLGGISIHSSHQKITRERLNYFLYNIRQNLIIQKKLTASIIYTQIETGLFLQFFEAPFSQYGHLATITFCVQIWRETEPNDVFLQSSSDATWVPEPLGKNDTPIMDIATSVYDNKGSLMINRCRLYLQVISLFDLLIFQTNRIHPSYVDCVRPPSHESQFLWPKVPYPPKKYWCLCGHFLKVHIDPLIKRTEIIWSPAPQMRYLPTHYKHSSSPHLYKRQNDDLIMYQICRHLALRPYIKMFHTFASLPSRRETFSR
jgi:hypothetical protein